MGQEEQDDTQHNESDEVLGHVPAGDYDTQLKKPSSGATSHRRGAGESPSTPPTKPSDSDAPSLPPPPTDPEAVPSLPRGGLVVMRRSGGLRFDTREIVVYRDGRIVQRRRGDGVTIYKGSARRLAAEQIADLERVIEQVQFPRFAGFGGRQSPDTVAYEIVARVGRRLKSAEVFQGTIPEALAPLVKWLNGLLDDDDTRPT